MGDGKVDLPFPTRSCSCGVSVCVVTWISRKGDILAGSLKMTACSYSMGTLKDFCPALTKLALDQNVKKSLSVCLFVCLSVGLSFRSFFQGV